MSEENDIQLVKHVLAAAKAQAEQAWAECPHLPPRRLWQAAVNQEPFSAEENQHLDSCEICRRNAGRFKDLVQRNAAKVVARLLVFVAVQRLRRLRRAVRFDDRPAAAIQPIGFVDGQGAPNPHIAAFHELDERGQRLIVEAIELPVGTLLQLVVREPGQADSVWQQWVVLGPPAPRMQNPVVNCSLEGALVEDRDRELQLDVFPPTELKAADAGPIRAAFASAVRDAEACSQPADKQAKRAAVQAGWHAWAEAALHEPALADEIRQAAQAVLQEILDAKPLVAETGKVQTEGGKPESEAVSPKAGPARGG